MIKRHVTIKSQFGARISVIDANTRETIREFEAGTSPDEALSQWVNESGYEILGVAISAPTVTDITSNKEAFEGRTWYRCDYGLTMWAGKAIEVPDVPAPAPNVPPEKRTYTQEDVDRMLAAREAHQASRVQFPGPAAPESAAYAANPVQRGANDAVTQ
jgi:hypothetical protein